MTMENSIPIRKGLNYITTISSVMKSLVIAAFALLQLLAQQQQEQHSMRMGINK